MRDGINVDRLVGLKRKDNEIRKSFDANEAIVLYKTCIEKRLMLDLHECFGETGAKLSATRMERFRYQTKASSISADARR